MSQLQKDRTLVPAALPPLDAPGVPAAEVAQYVERMCGDLGALSERCGLGFLAYLLEVAREEARLHAPPAPRSEIRHGELPPR